MSMRDSLPEDANYIRATLAITGAPFKMTTEWFNRVSQRIEFDYLLDRPDLGFISFEASASPYCSLWKFDDQSGEWIENGT